MRRLERLGKRRVAPEYIVSPEVARELAALSFETGRQIGILLDRKGRVRVVVVGDTDKIVIPPLAASRSGAGRLSGYRLVHTHLAMEDISEDDLMDLLFLRLDIMAMLKVSDGYPERLYAAHLVPTPVAGRNWNFLDPVPPTRQEPLFLALVNALEDEFAAHTPARDVDEGRDRALLINVTTVPKAAAELEMAELRELARAADVVVLDTVIQRRRKVNPKFILGRGKLAEIMLKALLLKANLLIFGRELNAAQVRSITDHTDLRVIDRTQLILDIFARRALSKEGKLQVEMAQLRYMLPRLGTRDDALSRLTGGIGARGPGETRLEIDRRRIKDRLSRLAAKLKAVGEQRHRRRGRRRKKDVPVISLVGYTNAGKSTLLNALTHSDIVAQDQLFATLDPTSRRLKFPQDVEVVITDTVGFIRDLPAELLKAFAATLEELAEADVLVHVVDVSNPAMEEQIAVVERLLDQLGLATIPRLTVMNKIDLADPLLVRAACARHRAVAISAVDRATFAPFLDAAQALVAGQWQGGRPC